MKFSENTKYMAATIGLLLLCAAYGLYHYGDTLRERFFPVATQAVHVHADFSFYILGERVDLTAEKYQSSAESVKHPDVHFHDGVDTLIHRHADGTTLGTFMASLGFTLTDSCVTTDTGAEYCTDDTNALLLFVNGMVADSPSTYITQEEDRLLLYYGDPQSADIRRLQAEITDEACIYSGNCPERGEPPFETCGLTCEI